MKKYRSPINPPAFKQTEPIGESLTIPGQAMSVREMMDRQLKGLPIMGNSRPLEPNLDGTGRPAKSFDLVEIQQMEMIAAAAIEDVESKKKQKAKEKADKEIEARIQAEIEKRSKTIIQEENPPAP